jgi:hypothetical protein
MKLTQGLLNWRNLLVMIGGNGNVKGLLTFNLEKQEWNEVKSDVPFNIWFPGML